MHATSHSPFFAMSLCHMDCNPGKVGMPTLPTQVYHHGPPGFDGFSNQHVDQQEFPYIMELRKEKSRDAARSRRGKENYEFYELAKMLPLPGAITSQLDKASIIRLTIGYLKLRDFSSHGDPPWNRDGQQQNKGVKASGPRRRSMNSIAMEIFEQHQGTHILQSLDGFLFSLSNDGRFLYISETVSIYLGLSQVEMTGSSVFDYCHTGDHAELAEQLGLSLPSGAGLPSPSSTSDEGSSSATATNTSSSTPRSSTPPIYERAAVMNPSPSKGYGRSFCIRMKSTLTKRGVHVKCSGYRVVHILCHMRHQFSFSLTRKHPPPVMGLVGMAIALPPPTINELLIDNDMFVTRLSPEFKIIYCEARISDLMDISPDDLLTKNLYDHVHAEDLQSLRKSHMDLLTKGQVLTDYYRILNKHGGYVWVQTCGTVICNVKNAEDQNIICINYILSGIEYPGCVMDTKQMSTTMLSEHDPSDHSEGEMGGPDHGDKREEHERKSPGNGDHMTDQSRHGQKRSHKSSHERLGNGNDVAELSTTSPENPLASLLYSNSIGEESPYKDDSQYGEKSRIDAKNSRRKMERPRKRRRESASDGEADDMVDVDNSASSIENLLNGDSEHIADNIVPSVATSTSSLNASQSPHTSTSAKIRSPIPEDLSVKAGTNSLTSGGIQSHLNGTAEGNAADKWHLTSSSHSDAYRPGESATSTSSVRDLEEVMNKHLPAMPSDNDPLRTGVYGDYSSAQSMLGLQKHKSTIQWIGSQHAAEGPNHPATHLLRSLYANRESVIRTNVYNPRPQYYSEMQPSLLTPPGGNAEPSPFTAPQAKTPPSTYSLIPGYSSNPISVTMSANLGDSYSMTPPSSVSPQDKYTYNEQCHPELRGYPPNTDGSAHPMPIKPQAYPLPAHATSHMYDRSPTAAQYATGSSYYNPASSFTAYSHSTSPTPAHYREAARTGTW